jgi:hypothetical protein
LAEHIKIILGYGSIQKTSSDSAVELVIISKKGKIDLVSLINGKFRTPKISKLNKLINLININYSRVSAEISDYLPFSILPLDVSPISENA